MPRRRTTAAWALFFLLVLLLPAPLYTQEPPDKQSCRDPNVVSVPSRPTVTSATETTQCGVVEIEYGLERQWSGAGATRDDLTGGLRFGMTPKLDFHWSSADFLHVMDGDGDRTGFGDTWLGLRYRLTKQTRLIPGFGVLYQAKIPSASVIAGLGSGKADHSFAFLVSKDIRQVHVDFNVIPLLAGRTNSAGFDHNVGFALSSAVSVTKRLGLVTEPYGYTSLNAAAPAFASWMGGLTYALNQRLILDTGTDFGITHDAPHKRVWVGFTCALTNIYARIRPAQRDSKR